MQRAFTFVQKNLHTSLERNKMLYNQKSGDPTFTVGQSVWRFYPPKASLKFRRKWEGPYLVTQRASNLCYRMQKHSRGLSLVVHVDHLKIYEGIHPVRSWLDQSKVPSGERMRVIPSIPTPSGQEEAPDAESQEGSERVISTPPEEAVDLPEGDLSHSPSAQCPGVVGGSPDAKATHQGNVSSNPESENVHDGDVLGLPPPDFPETLSSQNIASPQTHRQEESEPVAAQNSRPSRMIRKPEIDSDFIYY